MTIHQIGFWRMAHGIAAAAVVSTGVAEGATISLWNNVGNGCVQERTSTNDVAAGVMLYTPCVSPDGITDNLAVARGAFDAGGLSLGVYARMDTRMVHDELFERAFAQAKYSDELRIVGAPSAITLRLSFDVDGVLTWSYPPYANPNPDATQASVTLNARPISGSGPIDLLVPVFNGTAFLSLDMTADLKILAPTMPGEHRAHALADFLNTATLTSVAVLDASGQTISGASVVSLTDSSLAYPGPPTPVPEPASVLLLGFGLASAGGLRWLRGSGSSR